ncbi:hypothetical protein D3C81_1211740 [compost metagenome]
MVVFENFAEQSRFPCAVRADDRDFICRLDLEINVVQEQLVESHAVIGNLYDSGVFHFTIQIKTNIRLLDLDKRRFDSACFQSFLKLNSGF